MTEWFYRLDGVNQGPVSEADLKHIFDSGALPLTTAVWREGMEDWVEAGKMKTFCAQPIAITAIVNAAQNSASSTSSSFLSAKRIALVVCICIAGFGLWELKSKLAKTSRHASNENRQDGGIGTDNSGYAGQNLPSEQSPIASNAGAEPPGLNLNPPPSVSIPDVLAQQAEKIQDGDPNGPRAGDKQTIEKYIRAVTMRDKATTFELWDSVSSKNLYPIDINSVADPIQGDPEKVHKIIQYVSEKLKVDSGNDWLIRNFEIGCFGRSDLWVFRHTEGNRNHPLIESEVFLLRDLDPTSASIITKTDGNSGQQSFFVRFKCYNNRNRVVYVRGFKGMFVDGSSLPSEVQIHCVDEDDAKRVGKALAALIVAYGGKAELIDSTDSF